jgi:hypothetical protein
MEQSPESEEEIEERKREDFFAVLDLQNKSVYSSPSGSFQHNCPKREDVCSSPSNGERNETVDRSGESGKDFADIQSIISVTSAGGLLQDLSKSPPQASMMTAEYGVRYDSVAGEEELQDCFAAEFRRMKLKGEFPCRLCSAVFPNLRALKGHNRSHITGSVGIFRCNMCPYVNPTKTNLVRHMRTHNGDRPYECSICNYAFTTKANCERHLRNRHSILSGESVNKYITYHPSDESTNDPDLQTKLQAREDVKRSSAFNNRHSSSPEDTNILERSLRNDKTSGTDVQVTFTKNSSNMNKFKTYLRRALINNLEFSGGITFNSTMDSTVERLQEIIFQALSDYSRESPEEKMDCGDVKVEEEPEGDDDDENELVIDEEKYTEEEAADKRQSKEESKDTLSGGSSRVGTISSAKDVDPASVSPLLDNPTTHTQAFQRYFRGTQDGEDALEGSEADVEGLFTGNNSEGNNSGSDENK